MKVMHKPFQYITDNDLIEIIEYCFTLEVTISFNKTRKRLHKNERETVKIRNTGTISFYNYRKKEVISRDFLPPKFD